MSGKIVLHGSTLSLKSTSIRAKAGGISKVTFCVGGWEMEVETFQEPTNSPCILYGGADGRIPSKLRIEIHVEDEIQLPQEGPEKTYNINDLLGRSEEYLRPFALQTKERPEPHFATEGATSAKKVLPCSATKSEEMIDPALVNSVAKVDYGTRGMAKMIRRLLSSVRRLTANCRENKPAMSSPRSATFRWYGNGYQPAYPLDTSDPPRRPGYGKPPRTPPQPLQEGCSISGGVAPAPTIPKPKCVPHGQGTPQGPSRGACLRWALGTCPDYTVECSDCEHWNPKNKDQVPRKPPIGLRPRFVAEAARCQEILDAIKRYQDAKAQVPDEWLSEFDELMRGQLVHVQALENRMLVLMEAQWKLKE